MIPLQQIYQDAVEGKATTKSVQDIEQHKQEYAKKLDHRNWVEQAYTQTIIKDLNTEFERVLLLLLQNSEKWSDVEIRSAAQQLRTLKRVIAYTTDRTPLN